MKINTLVLLLITSTHAFYQRQRPRSNTKSLRKISGRNVGSLVHLNLVDEDAEDLHIESIAKTDETVGGLWFNATSLMKNVSFPNVFGGIVLGAVLTICGLFGYVFVGYQSSDVVSSSNLDGNSIVKPATLFEDILIDLKDGYVDDVNTNTLFETAVKSMLSTLDPYTEFENLGQAKQFQESVSGRYGGVGMIISGSKPKSNTKSGYNQLPSKAEQTNEALPKKAKQNDGVEVVNAFEGYAFDANIRTGDHIVAVDGVSTEGLDVEEVRNLLRGDPGTDAIVEIERDAYVPGGTKVNDVKERFKVAIQRQQVHMSDVKLATFLGDPHEGIGYISLNGFNADAGRDFKLAMLMLRYCAPNDLQGLVLDLRGNPGGLLDGAIEIASYLLPPESNIVSAKSKNEPEIVYTSSRMPIRPPNMRLAILVNGGSASASEVLSGAIQDLDAGVIVGPSRTYGKGLVQKIKPLPYDTALKYTIAKYYTPSGRCIQSVNYLGGRSPTNTENQDKSFEEKRDIINEDINGQDEASDNRAQTVSSRDRRLFYTKSGRFVRDGGGIEPDIKVIFIFVCSIIYSDVSGRTLDYRSIIQCSST
jgi:carboxyl-terminal processing protease